MPTQLHKIITSLRDFQKNLQLQLQEATGFEFDFELIGMLLSILLPLSLSLSFPWFPHIPSIQHSPPHFVAFRRAPSFFLIAHLGGRATIRGSKAGSQTEGFLESALQWVQRKNISQKAFLEGVLRKGSQKAEHERVAPGHKCPSEVWPFRRFLGFGRDWIRCDQKTYSWSCFAYSQAVDAMVSWTLLDVFFFGDDVGGRFFWLGAFLLLDLSDLHESLLDPAQVLCSAKKWPDV